MKQLIRQNTEYRASQTLLPAEVAAFEGAIERERNPSALAKDAP
jgi:hypothetical protein